ncbi:hypothetical protein [Clostridium sp. B9]|uniref:hypothetical protein n=1 Tax=Clostridium sp. B9 TaxID=3423224 RepID=UPI003D2F23B8
MNKLKKILYPIIVLIQLVLWVGVIAVQYFTKKSAGVMHHIYFKRYEYSNILTDAKLNQLLLSVVILTIVFLCLAIYLMKNKKDSFIITQLVILVIAVIILALVIKLKFFGGLLAYYYFIIVASIVFLLQFLWNVILLLKAK